MHFSKSMRAVIASVCCCTIFHPTLVFAQAPLAQAPIAVATPIPPTKPARLKAKTVDIELTEGREIVGQLVNHNGIAIASAPVEIWQKGTLIQTSMTDTQGRYRLANLVGGNYEIDFGDQMQPARCWTFGNAPPKSIASLRTIADEAVSYTHLTLPTICSV